MSSRDDIFDEIADMDRQELERKIEDLTTRRASMDKVAYAQYERNVRRFFEENSLSNLTHEGGGDDKVCPVCGEDCNGEGAFSWQPCDCCGDKLGGDRYHATGYSTADKRGYCFEVCMDCIHYAEYGQLDDMSMMEING